MMATCIKEETLTTPIHRVIEATYICRKIKIKIEGRGPKIENENASRDMTKIPRSQKK